jgi:hypothetical protein
MNLMPCPFCGSENLHYNGMSIACRGCGAAGPDFYASERLAGQAWNDRPGDLSAVLDGLKNRGVITAKDAEKAKRLIAEKGGGA